MNYQTICKKDCIHKENGVCKYGHNVQNSIFPTEQRKCIYYAAKIPKNEMKNQNVYF